ncbi:hypothetical protein [Methyloprofundus sp.]|uniref:hypothetical protein n=1 Tax=Methyloprofundus sp. TaxID=2020875 RepID=UPI003D095D6B
MTKNILLVAEGETDVIIFQAIAKHLSNNEITFIVIAPQKDSTSGTYKQHGFGEVTNWCQANKNKIQMLIDFNGASALFVQMDTDIAGQLNKVCIDAGRMQRQCCEEALNNRFSLENEPEHCYYILPTENTETWLLASHDHFTALDNSLGEIKDYELIIDTEQRLIDIGYPSRKKVGDKRKLNKKPARKYNSYAQQLVKNLSLARQRCDELNRLCVLILSV